MIPKHLPNIREMHTIKKIPQLLGDWQLQFSAASLQLLLDHNLLTGVWDFSSMGSSEAGAGLPVSAQGQVGLSAQSGAPGLPEDGRGWNTSAQALAPGSFSASRSFPSLLKEDTRLQSKAMALLAPAGRGPAHLCWGLWDTPIWLADSFSQ